MPHIVQVGAGSGGMVLLDLLYSDPAISSITIIEPDIYKPHNVERHYFGPESIGEFKAELAQDWIKGRRPDLAVDIIAGDVTDPKMQLDIRKAVEKADLGICAVDIEGPKYFWDALMRQHRKPWTLGEVLSGGIGGFVHWFVPDGPCYGCVASFLQRSMETERPSTPDYSQPGGVQPEVRIPASKAAVHAIASLHALVTLEMLKQIQEQKPGAAIAFDPGFSSLLLTLQKVPDVFDEGYRPYRFRIARSAECLICQPRPTPASSEDLDVALDQALARLGNA